MGLAGRSFTNSDMPNPIIGSHFEARTTSTSRKTNNKNNKNIAVNFRFDEYLYDKHEKGKKKQPTRRTYHPIKSGPPFDPDTHEWVTTVTAGSVAE